jgi:Aspartyl/Asparaginyl beta-hydroxylase
MRMTSFGVRGLRWACTFFWAQAAALGAHALAQAFISIGPPSAAAAALVLSRVAAIAWLVALTPPLLEVLHRIEIDFVGRLHARVVLPLLGLYALVDAVLGARALLAGEPAAGAPLLAAVAGAAALASAALAAFATIALRRVGRYLGQMRASADTYQREHDGVDLGRVARFLDVHAKADGSNPGLLVRGPSYPGLTSRPWHEPSDFAWVAALEAAYPAICEEAARVYGARDGFAPYDYPGVADPRWKSFFLFHGGVPHEQNCAACPETARVLASLPITLARDAMFSVVDPHAKIRPHRDSGNMYLTCHMGLRVPRGCEIRVGGEARGWQEGRCIIFDTAYEHEVSNDSDEARIVLLFDFFHPEFTADERGFFAAFREAQAKRRAP